MVNIMINKNSNQNSLKQKGVVLITGVIFLVILTMLVLAIMRSATLEERMASNAKNRQVALQAAEAVLRDAEDSLFSATSTLTTAFDPSIFNTGCANGLCNQPAANTYRWKNAAIWGNATSRTFATPASGVDFTLAGVPSQPRYIVEMMKFSGGIQKGLCPKIKFRITARGLGNDSSVVYVQNIYRLQPNKFADGSCG